MRIPVLWLLCSSVALAQSPERELSKVKLQYDAANYQIALETAVDALTTHNFSDEQRIELNKYAGAAAFNLKKLDSAEDHFYRVLQLNPDYVLDPFAFPPGAVKFFEDLKKKHAPTLDRIRAEIARRELEARRQAEERERARLAAEAERRRFEQLANQVTVRTVEKRSFLMNFVPFGVGQFQQGRTTTGVVLALTEGALAATSTVAYFALESLIVEETYYLPPPAGSEEPYALKLRGIPPDRAGEANAWRWVKLVSGLGFYFAYFYGVVDAIYHHQDEVVTETTEQRPIVPSRTTEITPRPFAFPVPGGAGGGITFTF